MTRSLEKLIRFKHSDRLITKSTKKYILKILKELEEEKRELINDLLYKDDIKIIEDDHVYFGFLGNDCAREWWGMDAFDSLPQFNPTSEGGYGWTNQEFDNPQEIKRKAIALTELFNYNGWCSNHRIGVKSGCSFDCTGGNYGEDCTAKDFHRVWDDSTKHTFSYMNY